MKTSRSILFPTMMLWIFSSGWIFTCRAQELSFPEVFGNHWDQALQFVKTNEPWMQHQCKTWHVDYKLAVSVVFPELVRYSALRDKMEVTLLKTLYTHYGSEYSDFSVGVFQMKPSCAEAVLSAIQQFDLQKASSDFDRLHRGLNEKAKRASIVRELENPRSQLRYVMAMITLLEKRFAGRHWKEEEEKVRFFAAAYHGGFNNSETWILSQTEARTFHTGLVKPAVCYSYAEVAVACYSLIW